MPLPDNRIRFDTSLIDFANDVGLTGQGHDDYPGPNQQPRYDWLRSLFIGLLSCQSSYNEPAQYRDGTLWFDLNNITLKIYAQGAWRPLSEVVAVVDGGAPETTMTLTEWVTTVNSLLTSTAPEATFSGRCTADNVTSMNIPEEIQPQIDLVNSRPIIYINGVLIDPRNSEFHTEVTIQLRNGIKLDDGDEFTVFIRNIAPQLFHVPDVVVP